MDTATFPWTILKIGKQLYAISAHNVEAIVVMPPSRSIPGTPEYVRGLVNLRGQLLTLVDFRVCVGLPSFDQVSAQFMQRMDDAKAAHKNWLAVLEKSVADDEPFSLTTDPHKCVFGRWYDSVTTDDLFLASLLKRIDTPHHDVHHLAIRIEELRQERNFDEIHRMLDEAKRGLFVEIMKHFDAVKTVYAEERREIVVAVVAEGSRFALAVDSVESVETLDASAFERSSDLLRWAGPGAGMDCSIGATKDNRMVIVIEDLAALDRDRQLTQLS